MSLHQNGDVKSVDTHRTTQSAPQNRPHNVYIYMSTGVYDATMLEDAQDQTSVVPQSSEIDQYVLFEHTRALNQSRISYDRYSY
jgi:hypothetical protein